MKSRILACAAAILVAAPAPAEDEFIAGADFSHLKFFEDRGIVYKDNGVPTDALSMLTNRGLNCVRLRLFTSTDAQGQSDPYNYINNLNYNLPLAVRVKNAGLKFMLDFHYSDSWADPGKQIKPAAWTNLSFTELVAEMRSYNSNCIAAFAAVGAMPDYVQIGNEITPGILWPDGRVGGSYDNQWLQLRRLLNSAIQGVRDAAGDNMPKIVIHLDRGGDWGATRWFFDHLRESPEPVEFDIIGESFYAWWHGDFDDLRNCLTNAAQRYGKPIFVAETGFPWGNSGPVLGFPASTNGQVEYVAALANLVKSIPDGLGAGIFWWGTEYVQLSGYNLAGFDRRSFFSANGNILPVAAAFGDLAKPAVLNASVGEGSLNLNWGLNGAGMTLTSSTSLATPPPWPVVTNPIQTNGAVSSVTVPIDSGSDRFYRLRAN